MEIENETKPLSEQPAVQNAQLPPVTKEEQEQEPEQEQDKVQVKEKEEQPDLEKVEQPALEKDEQQSPGEAQKSQDLQEIQDNVLYKIHEILTKHSSTQSEFIPQLYHSLKLISKQPNNSSNSLDAATSSIRHRLKTAKALLQQDPQAIELLSKTPEQWQAHILKKRAELEKKKQHMQRLRENVQKQ